MTTDTPESYTFTSGDSGSTILYGMQLVGSTSGLVFSMTSGNVHSGVLQPDTCTFSGVSATNGPDSFATASYVSDVINASLTVTPEPTSLALLALGGSFLFRRRAKRT